MERALYKKRHQSFRDSREALEAQYYLAWMTHISSGKFSFQGGLKRALQHFGILLKRGERLMLAARVRGEAEIIDPAEEAEQMERQIRANRRRKRKQKMQKEQQKRTQLAEFEADEVRGKSAEERMEEANAGAGDESDDDVSPAPLDFSEFRLLVSAAVMLKDTEYFPNSKYKQAFLTVDPQGRGYTGIDNLSTLLQLVGQTQLADEIRNEKEFRPRALQSKQMAVVDAKTSYAREVEAHSQTLGAVEGLNAEILAKEGAVEGAMRELGDSASAYEDVARSLESEAGELVRLRREEVDAAAEIRDSRARAKELQQQIRSKDVENDDLSAVVSASQTRIQEIQRSMARDHTLRLDEEIASEQRAAHEATEGGKVVAAALAKLQLARQEALRRERAAAEALPIVRERIETALGTRTPNGRLDDAGSRRSKAQERRVRLEGELENLRERLEEAKERALQLEGKIRQLTADIQDHEAILAAHKYEHPLEAEFDRGDNLFLFDDFLDLMTRLVDPKLEIGVLNKVINSESKKLYDEVSALCYRLSKLLAMVVGYFVGYLIMLIIDVYLITNSTFPDKTVTKLNEYRDLMIRLFDDLRPFPLYLFSVPLRLSFTMVDLFDVELPVEDGVTCLGMQAPMYLSLNYLIIAIVVILFDSCIFVFLSTSPEDFVLNKSFVLKKCVGIGDSEWARIAEQTVVQVAGRGASRNIKTILQILISKMAFASFVPLWPKISLACENKNPGSEQAARFGSSAVFWVLFFPTIHILLHTAVYGIAPADIDKDHRKEDGEGGFERGMIAQYHLNPLQKAGVVNGALSVNPPKAHKSGRKHKHTHKHKHHHHHEHSGSLQGLWDQVHCARIVPSYRATEAEFMKFKYMGYEFSCCNRCCSVTERFAKRWLVDLAKDGVTQADLQLLDHNPHFWHQPRFWLNYFVGWQASGMRWQGFKKYVRTMRWKIWQLMKITVGFWDQSLIDNMQIKNRCLKLDIDSSDYDQKHGAMLSAVGLAHSLIWQFIPYAVTVSKMGEALNISPIFVYDNTFELAIEEAKAYTEAHMKAKASAGRDEDDIEANLTSGGAPAAAMSDSSGEERGSGDDRSHGSLEPELEAEFDSGEDAVGMDSHEISFNPVLSSSRKGASRRSTMMHEQMLLKRISTFGIKKTEKVPYATLHHHESIAKPDMALEAVGVGHLKHMHWHIKVDSPHDEEVRGEGMIVWFEEPSFVGLREEEEDDEDGALDEKLVPSDNRWLIGGWLDGVRFGYAHFFAKLFAEVGFATAEQVKDASDTHAHFLVAHLRSSDIRSSSVAVVLDALEELRPGTLGLDMQELSVEVQQSMKDQWPVTKWLDGVRFGYGYFMAERFAELGFTSADDVVGASDLHAHFLVAHLRESGLRTRSVDLVIRALEKLRPGITDPPRNPDGGDSEERKDDDGGGGGGGGGGGEKQELEGTEAPASDGVASAELSERLAEADEEGRDMEELRRAALKPHICFTETDGSDKRAHGHLLDEEEVRRLDSQDRILFSDGFHTHFAGTGGRNLPTRKAPMYIQSKECILKFSSPGHSGTNFKLCVAYTGESPILLEGSKVFRTISWVMETIMFIAKVAICFYTKSGYIAFAVFLAAAALMSLVHAYKEHQEDVQEHDGHRSVLYKRSAWRAAFREQFQYFRTMCRKSKEKKKGGADEKAEGGGEFEPDSVVSPMRASEKEFDPVASSTDAEFGPIGVEEESVDRGPEDFDTDDLDGRIVLPLGDGLEPDQTEVEDPTGASGTGDTGDGLEISFVLEGDAGTDAGSDETTQMDGQALGVGAVKMETSTVVEAMDIEADVQPSDFGEVSADLGEIHIHLKETFESGAAEEKEAFTHVLTLEEQHEEVENALRLSARLETEEDEAAKNEEDEALSKRSRRAHRRRRRNEKGGQAADARRPPPPPHEEDELDVTAVVAVEEQAEAVAVVDDGGGVQESSKGVEQSSATQLVEALPMPPPGEEAMSDNPIIDTAAEPGAGSAASATAAAAAVLEEGTGASADISTWLDTVRAGYGKRFGPTFRSNGFFASADLLEAEAEKVDLIMKVLRADGVKKPTFRRIKAAIEALSQ